MGMRSSLASFRKEEERFGIFLGERSPKPFLDFGDRGCPIILTTTGAGQGE